jgi:hypothetical protein
MVRNSYLNTITGASVKEIQQAIEPHKHQITTQTFLKISPDIHVGLETACRNFMKNIGLIDFYSHTDFGALPPGGKLDIHIDTNDSGREYTVLCGLFGHSEMEWITYQMLQDDKYKKILPLDENRVYEYYDPEGIVDITAQQNLQEVFISSTDYPHTVHNNSLTDWGYFVTMRLLPIFRNVRHEYGF